MFPVFVILADTTMDSDIAQEVAGDSSSSSVKSITFKVTSTVSELLH
jgi:hypothetical protein